MTLLFNPKVQVRWLHAGGFERKGVCSRSLRSARRNLFFLILHPLRCLSSSVDLRISSSSCSLNIEKCRETDVIPFFLASSGDLSEAFCEVRRTQELLWRNKRERERAGIKDRTQTEFRVSAETEWIEQILGRHLQYVAYHRRDCQNDIWGALELLCPCSSNPT